MTLWDMEGNEICLRFRNLVVVLEHKGSGRKNYFEKSCLANKRQTANSLY